MVCLFRLCNGRNNEFLLLGNYDRSVGGGGGAAVSMASSVYASPRCARLMSPRINVS